MADLKDLMADLNTLAFTIEYDVNNTMPEKLGHESVAFIKNNFKKQSYDDGRWAPRSKVTNRIYDKYKFYKGTPYSSKNPILNQTGQLLGAIKYKAKKGSVDIGVFNDTATVKDVKEKIAIYAKSHNEGDPNSNWKAIKKTIRVPKRQFMPKDGDEESRNIKTIMKNVADDIFTKIKKRLRWY